MDHNLGHTSSEASGGSGYPCSKAGSLHLHVLPKPRRFDGISRWSKVRHESIAAEWPATHQTVNSREGKGPGAPNLFGDVKWAKEGEGNGRVHTRLVLCIGLRRDQSTTDWQEPSNLRRTQDRGTMACSDRRERCRKTSTMKTATLKQSLVTKMSVHQCPRACSLAGIFHSRIPRRRRLQLLANQRRCDGLFIAEQQLQRRGPTDSSLSCTMNILVVVAH